MNPRDITPRLEAVVEAISGRDGAMLPSQEEYQHARRILEHSGQRGSISLVCTPATIYHVHDSTARYMVAVHDSGGTILDAECSCRSARVCGHLLAVLAEHGGDLT